MEWLSKIFEWLKLPIKIIVFIALMSGIFLILPDNLILKLKLTEFLNIAGKYIGPIFTVSICFCVFTFCLWIIKQITRLVNYIVQIKRQHKIEKGIATDLEKIVSNLPLVEIYLLREFLLQGKDVIKVPYTNPEVTSLINKHIIEFVSDIGEGILGDIFMSARLTKQFKEKYYTYHLLQVKENPTKKDIEEYQKFRPAFVHTIVGYESLKNNVFGFMG